MKQPRFELGTRVTFSDTVTKEQNEDRTTKWVSNGLPSRTSYRMDKDRQWQPHKREFTTGIIIGQRSLSEYQASTESESDGWRDYSYTVVECLAGTSKKAWLVSYDLRRKPVLVLDEHIAKTPPTWVVLTEMTTPGGCILEARPATLPRLGEGIMLTGHMDYLKTGDSCRFEVFLAPDDVAELAKALEGAKMGPYQRTTPDLETAPEEYWRGVYDAETTIMEMLRIPIAEEASDVQ